MSFLFVLTSPAVFVREIFNVNGGSWINEDNLINIKRYLEMEYFFIFSNCC